MIGSFSVNEEYFYVIDKNKVIFLVTLVTKDYVRIMDR